jgi:hypothetical protein
MRRRSGREVPGGYMYDTEDAAFGTKKGRMYGRVYLAGELVRADEDKDYAVFEV